MIEQGMAANEQGFQGHALEFDSWLLNFLNTLTPTKLCIKQMKKIK